MSRNKKAFPSFFLIDNTKITNKETIADHFNTFFTNVGPKLSAGLSMKLIKKLIPCLAEPLTLIINQSLTTGIFPNKLKIAKVVPLYKKDDTNILENYRPISLLPVMSTIFEKVAYCQLYDYFTTNSLFYNSQHGFKKMHSTETAALEFLDRTIQIIDHGNLR